MSAMIPGHQPSTLGSGGREDAVQDKQRPCSLSLSCVCFPGELLYSALVVKPNLVYGEMQGVFALHPHRAVSPICLKTACGWPGVTWSLQPFQICHKHKKPAGTIPAQTLPPPRLQCRQAHRLTSKTL